MFRNIAKKSNLYLQNSLSLSLESPSFLLDVSYVLWRCPAGYSLYRLSPDTSLSSAYQKIGRERPDGCRKSLSTDIEEYRRALQPFITIDQFRPTVARHAKGIVHKSPGRTPPIHHPDDRTTRVRDRRVSYCSSDAHQ